MISSNLTDAVLFRGSADCVKVLDLEGRLRLINPGGVISLELERPDQLDGKVWWDMWPQPGNRFAEEAFKVALSGEAHMFSGGCSTARGTERWWQVTVSPIRDAFGAIENVLVVSRDVTDLKNAREALELSLRFKDEILETVAHELRNPLSAAVNSTQLLTLRENSADEVSRIASIINRQLTLISRMAEDILDASRVSRGELSFVPYEVDVNVIALTVCEQLRSAAEKKGQKLLLEKSSSPCRVQGDEMRLVQAVGNLVSNAIRYTPAKGFVRVSVHLEVQHARVVVSDSGVGISADRLAHLFDRYTRLQVPSDRTEAGLGLGLSLVKAIMGLHGGSVSVRSAGHNQGSTFELKIPILSSADPS